MLPPLHAPPPVPAGGRIRLVAPSSPFDTAAIVRGRALLQQDGFYVSEPPSLSAADRYLAAPDATRANELLDALIDPGVDLLLPARGGFGMTRLLPFFDERLDTLRAARPKLVCGFSDITALHVYLATTVGWRSVHGPVCTSMGLEPVESRQHWVRVIGGKAGGTVLAGKRLGGVGSSRGRLIGGNLAVLMALAGTRYWPLLRGCVLLLEDVGEQPYRLDRLLTQLMQASDGLSGIAGVALGRFTDCEELGKGHTAAQTLASFFAEAPFPVVTDLPIGHAPPNFAVPHGAEVSLDADAGTLVLLEEAAG